VRGKKTRSAAGEGGRESVARDGKKGKTECRKWRKNRMKDGLEDL